MEIELSHFVSDSLQAARECGEPITTHAIAEAYVDATAEGEMTEAEFDAAVATTTKDVEWYL